MTKQYKYYICDVFTEIRFGGNQLAVLPDATGLQDEDMLKIAREFNFSESTFVFPAEKGGTRMVRIYTPSREIPFAGHPNIGTAFVLKMTGEFGKENKQEVIFEEKAGLVAVTIEKKESIYCELKAPRPIFLGETFSSQLVAEALSLTENDILVDTHLPQVASVGFPFLLAEVKSRQILEKAKINVHGFEKMTVDGTMPLIHFYTKSNDEFDIRTRMFAPSDGIPEDPATGSANCALSGLLAHYDKNDTGQYRWRVAQGVEIGRPSTLIIRAQKTNGKVTDTWVGGNCVMISEGHIFI